MNLVANVLSGFQIVPGEHDDFKALILQLPDRLRRIGFDLIGYRNQAAKPVFPGNHHYGFALGLQLSDPVGCRIHGYL